MHRPLHPVSRSQEPHLSVDRRKPTAAAAWLGQFLSNCFKIQSDEFQDT